MAQIVINCLDKLLNNKTVIHIVQIEKSRFEKEKKIEFLRSLRSYFVVKSLHFLKESKYFSLFPILRNQKITEKIEKMYPQN